MAGPDVGARLTLPGLAHHRAGDWIDAAVAKQAKPQGGNLREDRIAPRGHEQAFALTARDGRGRQEVQTNRLMGSQEVSKRSASIRPDPVTPSQA